MKSGSDKRQESSLGKNEHVVAEQPAKQNVIARNVAANWIWYSLVVVSGFILPRFIDETHGAELLGVWDFAWSLIAYVSLLALAVGSSVQRYVAKYRAVEDWDSLNSTVNTCLALLTASSIVGLVATGMLAAAVPHLLPAAGSDAIFAARRVIIILGVCCAMQMPGGVFNAVVTGYERFDIFNVVRGAREMTLAVYPIRSSWSRP